jgi:aspartate/methionine/tyrosine aminotransferase
MPRPGSAQPFDPAVLAMPGAVYSPFADRIEGHEGRLVPLHVGDTWMEPFAGAQVHNLRREDYAGIHRYGPTQGIPQLVDAIVGKVRSANGLACERENVLVGAGATSVLANAIAAVTSPGEEVLILAPFWPLVRGIVQEFHASPIEVPFFDRVFSLDDAVAAVRERITERSVALYVSTPSNPTGRILPREWLAALAELAREHDLWLIADEVYEAYVYEGQHFSVGALAPERTISVFSFSKTYGMAGNRVGYLVAPAEVVHEAHKVGTHTAYHAPIAGQVSALRALQGGGEWVANARELYREAGRAAAATLGLPTPEGSTFLFVDVAEHLDERGLPGFLEDCFDDGVLVAPGAASGSDYGNWVRLCYTSAPVDDVRFAVDQLAKRLGRPGAA